MEHNIKSRFRGFLPVIIDVETGGVDPQKDALLELGAVSIKMDEEGLIHPDHTYHYHIQPYEGTNLDPKSLAFNKIDPHHPFRFAIPEAQAIKEFFEHIEKECQQKKCHRAVIVGHNAWFDQHFVNAAAKRSKISHSPFHRFTSLDTASLSALAYGHTVLPKVMEMAGIPFNADEAHSAIYDAEKTAELFCKIVNRWKELHPD